MTERKLTPKEIELIYDFCCDRGISEYEIQSELVDHLASAIEETWKEKPDSSFHDALFEAYHQFGPDGFKKLAKSKKRAFQRQYNLVFLKFLGSFFQLPRIILTFALCFSLFAILRVFEAREPVMFFIQGFSLALYLWYILFFFPRRLAFKVKKKQAFLFLNYIELLRKASNLLVLFLVQAINMSFRYFEASDTTWFDFGLSFMVVFLFIIGYALMFYMPQLTRRHFKEQFPQFVQS